MHFKNRKQAGHLLARSLEGFRDDQSVVIYAISKSGIILGVELAQYLQAPLGVIIPRRIYAPDRPGVPVCALTEDGHIYCHDKAILERRPAWLTDQLRSEQAKAHLQHARYLAGRKPIDPQGKTVIIVDDGVHTGLTMRASINAIKDHDPASITVAAPVIPSDVADRLKAHVDELICLEIPAVYAGDINTYYDTSTPVTDDEVVRMLAETQPSRRRDTHSVF